ncbi:N-acetylmuramoyl-L-alanine amidase [Indiicoccus explosivorum]|uniref:N-acetylmuramoyl-L-alanine amidase n=1 Tax=Indiicoccus explosivorum TaxID=1917864 RepID=UPI000B43F149|nr:N-acetylmuramoyl-L-alanine amidase [Indiicoccus explosivorum]
MKKKWIAIYSLIFLLIAAILAAPASAHGTAQVDVPSLNVRSGPGLSYSITGSLGQGDQVTITDEQGDWYRISENGWIAAWLTTSVSSGGQEPAAASGKTAVSTVNRLNVRSQASLSGAVLGKMNKGDTARLLSETNGWYEIEFRGTRGFVSAQYISVSGSAQQPAAAAAPAASDSYFTVAVNGLNVRAQATTASAKIGMVAKGQSFSVLSVGGDWVNIRLADGTSGWVYKAYGTLSGQPAASAPVGTGNLSGISIVIDPGHGGIDGGTSGYYGTVEKGLTLQTAEILAAQLRAAGASVTMTRTSDVYINLRNRVSVAHQLGADAFISLHYDASYDRSVNGFTTYYQHSYQQSLASHLNGGIDASTILLNRGTRQGNYFVLRENMQPAVLIELGFLSNPNEEQAVSNDYYRRQAAQGITNGLINYFN